MSRSVTEVIRRAFDLTIANWQLVLLRLAEQVIFALVAIASIVAIVIPIGVSAGLGRFHFDPDLEPVSQFLDLLAQHWMLLVFILLLISVVLLAFVILHSFVQAGCAQVYIDGVFSSERFVAGGKRGWRSTFWIYNIAWLFAGLVMLVPLLPVPFILLLKTDTVGFVLAGCVFALWIFFALLVALWTALWSTKAIALAMTRNLEARPALAAARAAIRADRPTNYAVAFIVMVIWIGGSALISMISAMVSVGHATPLALITAPLQIVMSLVSAVFSSAMASLFLASLISME